MKKYIWFILKVFCLATFASQATTASTLIPFLGEAVAEPIYLTFCGLALLYVGSHKKEENRAD